MTRPLSNDVSNSFPCFGREEYKLNRGENRSSPMATFALDMGAKGRCQGKCDPTVCPTNSNPQSLDMSINLGRV